MSSFIVNTRGRKYPEGHFKFQLKEITKGKTEVKKFEIISFVFAFMDDEGVTKRFAQNFMPWQCDDIFAALGLEGDVNGKFEVVPEKIIGKAILADIVYVPNKKSGREYAELANIEAAEISEAEFSDYELPQEGERYEGQPEF